jgi:hypothetical protein
MSHRCRGDRPEQTVDNRGTDRQKVVFFFAIENNVKTSPSLILLIGRERAARLEDTALVAQLVFKTNALRLLGFTRIY